MNPAGRYVVAINALGAALKHLHRPSDEEVTITRMLDKVLRRSDALDKESLCILAGERVRVVALLIICGFF